MISFPREWETEPGQHHPLQNVAVASFHLFLSLSQPSWKCESVGWGITILSRVLQNPWSVSITLHVGLSCTSDVANSSLTQLH